MTECRQGGVDKPQGTSNLRHVLGPAPIRGKLLVKWRCLVAPSSPRLATLNGISAPKNCGPQLRRPRGVSACMGTALQCGRCCPMDHLTCTVVLKLHHVVVLRQVVPGTL